MKEELNPELTYGIVGLFLYAPSKRWLAAGIRAGDVVVSSSLTHALNSPEKIHEALAAPPGTEVVVQRTVGGKLERVTVTL